MGVSVFDNLTWEQLCFQLLILDLFWSSNVCICPLLFQEENWERMYTSLVVQKSFSAKAMVNAVDISWTYIYLRCCQTVEKSSIFGIPKWSLWNFQRVKGKNMQKLACTKYSEISGNFCFLLVHKIYYIVWVWHTC